MLLECTQRPVVIDLSFSCLSRVTLHSVRTERVTMNTMLFSFAQSNTPISTIPYKPSQTLGANKREEGNTL